MDKIENTKKKVVIPKIIFDKNEKTRYVSEVMCASSGKEVRIAFIEEKLVNNQKGNINMAKVCDTQIVMTLNAARNMIDVLEKHLSGIDE